jgi:hypothetical protein
VSLATASHAGHLQSSGNMIANPFLKFGSLSKLKPKLLLKVCKPASQFGFPQKAASPTVLQLLSAPNEPSVSRSGSSSTVEEHSGAPKLPTTYSGTAVYQFGKPPTMVPASQATASLRTKTKSPSPLFRFASSSDNEAPNQEVGTSGFHFP